MVRPTNPAAKDSRNIFKKQQQVLRSDASLVEIDLVRSGQRVLALPNQHIGERYRTDYLACISPGWKHSRREVYRMPFRERLPLLPIPLRQHEHALPLDLQLLVERAYEAGRYEIINYSAEPGPPLSAEDDAWAAELLKRTGRR